MNRTKNRVLRTALNYLLIFLWIVSAAVAMAGAMVILTTHTKQILIYAAIAFTIGLPMALITWGLGTKNREYLTA